MSVQQALDRFASRGFGVFNHYLCPMQNGGWEPRNPSGRITDWDSAVKEFDTDLLAYNLHEMGAGYYCITLMQSTKYLCAPNETFDRISGTKPGEACCTRDLPLDLYKSLSKYDIDLFLYLSADGPLWAYDINPALVIGDGTHNLNTGKVHEEFVAKWASVMQEWAERYGDKVKGWWIDRCYDEIGYSDELLEYYHRAAKAGNPDSLIACNRFGTRKCAKGLSTEEFTCGEQLDFNKLPESRFVDGAQAHLLIPLGVHPTNGDRGHTWCMPGAKRNREELLEFMQTAKNRQIPITVDIAVYRDGSFDSEQQEILTYVGRSLK